VAVIPISGGFSRKLAPTTDQTQATDVSAQAVRTAPVAPAAQVRLNRTTTGQTDFAVSIITTDVTDKAHVEWGPEPFNPWLVYEAEDEDKGYTQVRRIRPDGQEEEQLTSDAAEHHLPQYLTPTEVIMQWSPDDQHDRLARLNVNTGEWLTLTPDDRDYEEPNALGTSITYAAQNDQGIYNLGLVSREGGNAHFICSEAQDVVEPDLSQDGSSVYAAQACGDGSSIGWVSATGSSYLPATGGDAMRANPDVYYAAGLGLNLVIYERQSLELDDGYRPTRKPRKGTGIFLVRHRRPLDGATGVGLDVLSLEQTGPDPSTGKVTICWQVPTEQHVTMKLYNTAGQLARTLVNRPSRAGKYATVWDGSDDRGRKMSNGVYLLKLAAGDKQVTYKLVVRR